MPLNHTTPAIRRRITAALLVGALTVPAPAFGQGAGDDQYRDPFPETTAQSSPSGSSTTSTTGQGLSQTPPTSTTQGADTGSGSGSTESSSGSAASTDSPDASETTTSGSSEALPQTGDDPWLVALAGAALLLLGAGLRLRGGAQRRH
jgi:LPXTG-motif cell wall-anchored protein